MLNIPVMTGRDYGEKSALAPFVKLDKGNVEIVKLVSMPEDELRVVVFDGREVYFNKPYENVTFKTQ